MADKIDSESDDCAPSDAARRTYRVLTAQQTPEPGWHWYVGDGDNYHARCDSREEAVEAALDYEGAWIVEATKERMSLADYFDSGWFLEGAEDGAEYWGDPNGDSLIFDVGEDQADDLQLMVRAAIREWQAKHKLVFLSHTFAETRNEEFIGALPPKGEATPEPNDPAAPSAPESGEQQ